MSLDATILVCHSEEQSSGYCGLLKHLQPAAPIPEEGQQIQLHTLFQCTYTHDHIALVICDLNNEKRNFLFLDCSHSEVQVHVFLDVKMGK